MKQITSSLIFLFTTMILSGCVSMGGLPSDKLVEKKDDFKNVNTVKLTVYAASEEKIQGRSMLIESNFYKELSKGKIQNGVIDLKIGCPPYMNKVNKKGFIKVNNETINVIVKQLDTERITDISSSETTVASKTKINVRSTNYNILIAEVKYTEDLEKKILQGNNFSLRIYSGTDTVTLKITETKYNKLKQFAAKK